MTLKNRHVISVEQFERSTLDALFRLADASVDVARGQRVTRPLEGKVLANLFFEPSTRTRLSFGTAFLRLGGSLETTVGMQFSSMAKGETLEDTVRVIDGYADVIVLRHPERGSAQRAASVASHPVINGGDGPGEHPTQALLDAYTIRRERGGVDGLQIALIGDLKYGRTVHSLARLLTRYNDVEVLLVCPDELVMPDGVLEALAAADVPCERVASVAEAAAVADVLYVTRIQVERFPDPAEATRHANQYIVDRRVLEASGRASEITILHPLPRFGDLATDVDDLPGAAYFRQAHYGVPVRMGLFCAIFGVEP